MTDRAKAQEAQMIQQLFAQQAGTANDLLRQQMQELFGFGLENQERFRPQGAEASCTTIWMGSPEEIAPPSKEEAFRHHFVSFDDPVPLETGSATYTTNAQPANADVTNHVDDAIDVTFQVVEDEIGLSEELLAGEPRKPLRLTDGKTR